MGGFVTFLLEQSPVFGSWLKPCCQGLKQLGPTSSRELTGLARPDLATLVVFSVLNTLFCSQRTTPSVGVLSDTPRWGGQLRTTRQSRRAQASLPQQPRPLHLSEGPHEVEAAPRQPGQEREGRPRWWDGGSVLRFPSLELSDGRAIFTAQALRAALLISCMCPCFRWGQGQAERGWGVAAAPF